MIWIKLAEVAFSIHLNIDNSTMKMPAIFSIYLSSHLWYLSGNLNSLIILNISASEICTLDYGFITSRTIIDIKLYTPVQVSFNVKNHHIHSMFIRILYLASDWVIFDQVYGYKQRGWSEGPCIWRTLNSPPPPPTHTHTHIYPYTWSNMTQ